MAGGFGPTTGASVITGASTTTGASSDGAVIRIGGGATRPIGISPARDKRPAQGGQPAEDWYRGNKWPPVEPPVQFTNLATSTYSVLCWDPENYSYGVLAEFVSAPAVAGVKWDTINLPPIPNAALIKEELKDLILLIDYRPGVLAESLHQVGADGMLDFWRGIFTFKRTSHPYTYYLAWAGLRVAQFQALHYKHKLVPNRPRPSQLCPSLMPPIDPPGHASYPSGHATESYLLSLCLKEVMPTEAHDPLMFMAERCARNREVIGVHYKSDTVAGELLAKESFKILKTCPSLAHPTNGLIAKATAEWQ